MIPSARGVAALFTAAALIIATIGAAAVRAERANTPFDLWPVEAFNQDTLPPLRAVQPFTPGTETDMAQILRLVK